MLSQTAHCFFATLYPNRAAGLYQLWQSTQGWHGKPPKSEALYHQIVNVKIAPNTKICNLSCRFFPKFVCMMFLSQLAVLEFTYIWMVQALHSSPPSAPSGFWHVTTWVSRPNESKRKSQICWPQGAAKRGDLTAVIPECQNIHELLVTVANCLNILYIHYIYIYMYNTDMQICKIITPHNATNNQVPESFKTRPLEV